MSMNPIWAADNANLADDVATLRVDRDNWQNNAGQWKQHAEQLEGRVDRLTAASKAWREEAIDNGASALVREDAFKEVTGKGVREYFGDQEIDKRMDEARPAIREGYGQ